MPIDQTACYTVSDLVNALITSDTETLERLTVAYNEKRCELEKNQRELEHLEVQRQAVQRRIYEFGKCRTVVSNGSEPPALPVLPPGPPVPPVPPGPPVPPPVSAPPAPVPTAEAKPVDGDSRYRCSLCQQAFRYPSYYKRHYQRAHGGKPSEVPAPVTVASPVFDMNINADYINRWKANMTALLAFALNHGGWKATTKVTKDMRKRRLCLRLLSEYPFEDPLLTGTGSPRRQFTAEEASEVAGKLLTHGIPILDHDCPNAVVDDAARYMLSLLRL